MSNPLAYGNGSVFKDGYAIGQNAALKQNEMNNAIGGKGKGGSKRKGSKRRKMHNGGGITEVPPVHAAYPNSGIQSLNTNLTAVTAQQQANAKFDVNIAKTGGSRRRTRRNLKRRRSIRKSRRHM